jgi:DNA-binding transcriptional MerR regulator
MRMAELAEISGVPVATVKYYLREGLLPPGRAVTARLAEYDESHVRRLRLLRVLREVGDVPVSRLQALAQAVEARTTLHELLAVAADSLAPAPPATAAEHRAAADALVAEAGWRVRAGAPDRGNLAAALERIAEHTGERLDGRALALYVRVADELARHEIDHLDDSQGRAALMEQMVLGQVLFGHVLDLLRRLAEEHHSAVRFGAD